MMRFQTLKPMKIQMSNQNIYHVVYSYVSISVNLAKSESSLANVVFSLWALIWLGTSSHMHIESKVW